MLYEQVSRQRARPSDVFAADPEAREVTERLIRDAGFDPVYAGGLDHARTLEDHIASTAMLGRSEIGPYFSRFAAPGALSG